jgi:glutathione S-transferase
VLGGNNAIAALLDGPHLRKEASNQPPYGALENKSMLKLYYIPAACSLASHIALTEAGADFQSQEIDYSRGDHKSPEFLKLNPKAFVPVLVTDQGPITENVAILLYISMTFPKAGLYPSNDPFGFARVQEFNTFLSSSLHVTYRHISRPRLFADGAVAKAALRAKVPEMVHKYFGLIEARLSDGRTWVHGDRYTTSDPYLFVYASYLQWGDRGDAGRFPLVRAHRERVLARPATQTVLAAEGIPDPAIAFGPNFYQPAIDGDDSSSC